MKEVYIGTMGANIGDMIRFSIQKLGGVTRTEIRPGFFQVEPVILEDWHVGMIISLTTWWNGNTDAVTFTITGGKSFDVRPDFVVQSI